MVESNLLPEFHQLLREALSADDEADHFDVHSGIKESKEKWDRLNKVAAEAKIKLIKFVQDNPSIVQQLMELHKAYHSGGLNVGST